MQLNYSPPSPGSVQQAIALTPIRVSVIPHYQRHDTLVAVFRTCGDFTLKRPIHVDTFVTEFPGKWMQSAAFPQLQVGAYRGKQD